MCGQTQLVFLSLPTEQHILNSKQAAPMCGWSVCCLWGGSHLQGHWPVTCGRSGVCWSWGLVQQRGCHVGAAGAPVGAVERQVPLHHRPAQRAGCPQGRLLPALLFVALAWPTLLCKHRIKGRTTT